ncbi:High-affinity proline transporter PutP [BD1-7 clade bacterium]|uniref:High-affinity proline transporter PutP n=1 Tax=BD1-7 clade bacterium TaxID=2029982 RepID=A0A5S9PQQ0_9GAMM|nr:High-affinity proline transporter PutP [BD1-7 clade bacterium]
MFDISIIVAFLVANLLIGYYCGRDIRTFSEYSVWQRSFSVFAICATLTASFVGGGYTLGNASKVYDIGMIYAYGLLGFSLKEIMVALFIAPRMDAFNDCHSVGDIMEKRYGLRAKMITGVFSVLICTGILGAQVSAIGALFTTFFGISQFYGLLAGYGVMIAYAALGGMRSVVYTDVLQFCILMIGIPLAFFFGLHAVGGWHNVAASVPAASINPFLGPDGGWALFALMLTFFFGEILVPPYVQRLFMARTSRETLWATLISGLISVPIFLISGAIGLIALVMNPDINANLAVPYVVDHAMPVGLKGLVIASLLAIIMSSAAGFLNAAAIAFTNDIFLPLCKRDNLSHKAVLLLARCVALFVGLGAIAIAFSVKNILDILVYAYNMWSPVILVPLVAVIFGWRTGKREFYASACAGGVSMLVWSLILGEPYHLTGNVVGVVVSLLAFVVCRVLWRTPAAVPNIAENSPS